MKKFGILLSMLVVLVACKNNDDPIGLQSNTIKFSTSMLKFDSSSSIKEITSEGDQWLINDLKVDDKIYNNLDFIDYDGLLIERQEIKGYSAPFKIENDWFTITREFKKLSVELKANDSDNKRVIEIGVFDRNYNERIRIEQEGYEL